MAITTKMRRSINPGLDQADTDAQSLVESDLHRIRTELASKKDVLDAVTIMRDHVRSGLVDHQKSLEVQLSTTQSRCDELEDKLELLGEKLEQSRRQVSESNKLHAQHVQELRGSYEAALSRQGEVMLKALPSGTGEGDVTEIVSRFGKVLEEKAERRLTSLRGEYETAQDALRRDYESRLEIQRKSFEEASGRQVQSLAEVQRDWQAQMTGLQEALRVAREEFEARIDASQQQAQERSRELKDLLVQLTHLSLLVPEGALQVTVASPSVVHVQPTPVEVTVPEGRPPEIVVRVPPPRLVKKTFTYLPDGRPSEILEVEQKEEGE